MPFQHRQALLVRTGLRPRKLGAMGWAAGPTMIFPIRDQRGWPTAKPRHPQPNDATRPEQTGGMVSGKADGHGPLRFLHRQALPADPADVPIGYYGGVRQELRMAVDVVSFAVHVSNLRPRAMRANRPWPSAAPLTMPPTEESEEQSAKTTVIGAIPDIRPPSGLSHVLIRLSTTTHSHEWHCRPDLYDK
ncbi:hypothetical protein LCGC14_2569950 [marine sediment metagenome]|uniref:Uncharacterized protein n=1 Tax=marine sediment metagenome TaxID=412755 RepID=A0A0F9AHG4_9ZZZZ